MAELIQVDLSCEAACVVDLQIEEMFVRMSQANEQMVHDQAEIERLKKETAMIIANLQMNVM